MENTTVKTEVITIPVDAETAKAFKLASEAKKKKIEIFLRIQLKNALDSTDSLQQVMNEMGREAQANGLTPEILQSILEDE
jgi:hypothetical protein